MKLLNIYGIPEDNPYYATQDSEIIALVLMFIIIAFIHFLFYAKDENYRKFRSGMNAFMIASFILWVLILIYHLSKYKII